MNKTTLVALSLTGILALSGCSSMDSKVISGRAIDPYLVGATVCLADDDRVCLTDEVSVTTDENGVYELTVSGEHFGESHHVVVRGGTDAETGATFTGSIVALHEANATATLHITPLTTWLSAEYREANATTHEARVHVEANLMQAFDLDFHADVVAQAKEGNTTGLKASIKFARCAELYDANHTFGFYVYVARGRKANHVAQIDQLLHDAATEAEQEAGGTGLRNGIDDVIDAANNAHDTAHDIAQDAHDTAHNAAGNIHGFVHGTVCNFTGTCNP